MFTTPSVLRSRSFRRRAACRTKSRRTVRRRRLIIEPLEARTLLSLAPLGAEFRVNETTFLDQRITPGGAVAADDEGAFAVVWSSQQQDGSGDGVYVRAYNADGSPRMAELLVNEYSAGDQTAPAIASDDLGNMMIVWQSAGQDGDGWGIYGRRFAITQVWPIEIPVNQYTLGNQTDPQVAWDAGHSFVVVWSSSSADPAHTGIFARRFG